MCALVTVSPPPYALFFDSLLAAPAASFDITGIPAGFLMEIVVTGRCDNAALDTLVSVQFNGDSTAAHYQDSMATWRPGVNPVQFASGATLGLGVGFITSAASVAGDSAMLRSMIPDYATTTFRKNVYTQSSAAVTRVGVEETDTILAGGTWLSTVAVSRVTVLPDPAANFIAGSRCRVYLR